MMLNKTIATIAILLSGMLITSKAFAWGRDGHHIVAEIAMQHMNAATKTALLKVLGTTSPEDAATWMDDMRSNHAYDFMKPWHYVDFEKGTTYPARTEENAVTEMTAAWLDLKHMQSFSEDQVKVSVMVLFHLTGDLHMPLHTGYAEDKGGNGVQVQFNGSASNLHRVWDDDIIQQQGITLATVEALYPAIKPEELQHVKTIDIVGWMNESRAYLPQVYGFTGNQLDNAYALAARPVVQKQLLFAGLRLAALMENIFSKAAQPLPAKVNSDAVTGSMQVAVSKAVPAGSIPAEDAIKHIGENVTVCGHVYGGKYLDRGNNGPTFLNIGAAYPNSPFTVVIFKNDRGNFSYAPETFLDGKDICVTGTVKDYKGKAEIIIENEKQIVIQ